MVKGKDRRIAGREDRDLDRKKVGGPTDETRS